MMRTAQTVANLVRPRVHAPPEQADAIAARKGESTAAGIAQFVLGAILTVGGLAVALIMALQSGRSAPDRFLIVFGVLVLLAGVYFIGVGTHRMSGEATVEAEKGGAGFFTVLAKLLRVGARLYKSGEAG